MIFPVWVSAWEIGCCQPEAVVGQPWKACLFLHPPASDDASLAVVTLDVDVVRPAPAADGYGLARVGGVAIGVKGARDVGALNFQGRMLSRWHGPDPHGVELDEVASEGTVRRVRLVPCVFERRGDGVWSPIGQLAATDVGSTSGRRKFHDIETDANGHQHRDDLLVDLEIFGS